MSEVLKYEEAYAIYNAIDFKKNTPIHKNIIETAIEYVQMRVKSEILSDKEFTYLNTRRTDVHNILIGYVEELYILQKNQGCTTSWIETLGDDRKMIGDLACWLVLFKGLENR